MNGSEQRSFLIFYVLGTLLALAIAGGVWYVWAGKQKREAQEASSRAATEPAVPPPRTMTSGARGKGPASMPADAEPLSRVVTARAATQFAVPGGEGPLEEDLVEEVPLP